MFTKNEVLRSFRKFNTYSEDVCNATFKTWDSCLKTLIAHCQQDKVMQVVIEPLLNNKHIDLKKWHRKFDSSGGSMIGSKVYSLPTDNDDRNTLFYQLLSAFSTGEYSAQRFGIDAFGGDGPQEVFEAINRHIVEKFTRDVSEKLEEVETELGDSDEVSAASLTIFNYGSLQHIQGGVHGGVAAQNSTVTDNKLTYNDASQLARAVKALGENLNDVLDDNRESVSGAFALLVRAIETNTVLKPVEVATTVQAIGEGSPSGLKRLRGIIDNAAGSLLADALKPLIALLLGAETGG